MKKYLLVLFALLCLGILSCENKEEVTGVAYDPTVLISNYGLRSGNIWDDKTNSQEFHIYTECAGAYDGEVKVKLVLDEAALQAYNQENGTEYKLMPADCYSLDAASKKMTDKQAEFVVTFDVDKLMELAEVYDYSDIAEYVIPYSLVSETAGLEVETLDGVNSILVNPNMTHVLVEKFHLVAPSADGIVVTEDAYSLSYKLVAEDNRWASGYDFEVTVTDDDNNVLLEGIDYQLVCSSDKEAFEVGDSEITYTLSLITSMLSSLPLDVMLTVKAELKGVKNGFVVDGTGVSKLKLEPFPLWDKSGVDAADLDYNSWDGNTNNAPIKLFDGNKSTFWHNSWGQNAPAGWDSERTPWRKGTPCFVGVDFGEEIKIHALCALARQDGYAGRFRAGGYNFDWETKSIKAPQNEIGGNSQWMWKLETLPFDVPFCWDASYLTKNGLAELTANQWAPTGKDTDGADNQVDRNWYREAHWTVLDKDVTTRYLQIWSISESWDWPRTGEGGVTAVAELDIRLGSPKIYFDVE